MAIWKKEISDEAKKQLWLAGPMIFVCVFQYSLQVISLMFVGHLDELLLAGASLATSFVNATGFNVLMGMSSALDTFCGQAYGAKQFHMLGVHTQGAMLVLTLVTIPVSIIWVYLGPILVVLRQDKTIAAQAQLYARYLIPSLPANGLLRCITKFLQTQNIVFPMVLATGLTSLLHFLLCWALVLKIGLGIKGSAIAICISNWFNTILLALYIRLSPSCKTTWTGFSKESLHNIPRFLRLAFPSVLMVCLEAWTFEIMVLLSGALPNAKLQTSVLSIWLVFVNILGGVARGCGWQKLGAFVNLGSYYFLGVPFSIVSAFVLHLKAQGLFLGIVIALIVQLVCFLAVTLRANWEKEVSCPIFNSVLLSSLNSSVFVVQANKAATRVGGNGIQVEALPSDQSHLDELLLAGASLATSFVNVTGFNVLMGMSSALDTFCGQAYGARQYHMVGIHTQGAMLVLTLVTIPVSIIWVYLGPILVVLRQDKTIAAQAQLYARYLIPSLSANGLLRCIVKFLQTQSLVFPMVVSTGLTSFIHVLICWALVLKLGLGFKGSAIAICISNWFNTILLSLYVRFSPSCKTTWTGFSKESLHNIPKFLRLAFPSALMVCLEAWTFELMVLLSGALPNAKLQTSVLSICLNTTGIFWMVPFGVSAAGRCCQRMWLAKLGALLNLGSYYFLGVPFAIVLAFFLHMEGQANKAAIRVGGSRVQVEAQALPGDQNVNTAS
ncbi:MATE efflux family protein DTX1 [Spatholobus suberectus]|nr:MATE efflux family protein DTX1 [Spatholobus suberectus]